MRLILPERPNFDENHGEKQVYEFLKANMISNSVTYYNYTIDGKQFDFCIALEGKGVLIVEVKSYIKDTIVEVKDNNHIIIKGGARSNAPQSQAREYVEALWPKSKKALGVDIPIIPVSWFTNLSELDFKELQLDKIGDKELTLFKEDFDKNRFKYSLEKIFEFGRYYNKKGFANFDSIRLNEFRTIFETKSTLPKIEKQINRGNEKHTYSILKVFNTIDINRITRLLDNWSRGTKLYLITDNKESFYGIRRLARQKLKIMGLEERFKEVVSSEESYIIYGLNMYFVNYKLGEEFEVLDGFENEKEKLELYSKTLTEIDKRSYFNLGQYLVEHSTDNNILVKAGAGTGKTHTMISRLMYLIHINRYTSDELKEKIVMITFTNEAADSMRNKIKEEFMDYYILTKDISFIYHINAIVNMRISTIHVFIKALIEEYGYLLGYGSNISIVKGIMDRREGFDKHLNNIIEGSERDPIMDENLDLNYFKLERFTMKLINKIEGRNIDFINDSVDLGNLMVNNREHPELDSLIKNVMQSSEKDTRSRVKDFNKIILSQLLLELKNLIGMISEGEYINEIDYMFIDEFQDTDNAQIDLIKELHTNMEFKLFIVGDVKQGIYRFRGAKTDAFERLTSSYGEDEWNRYKLGKNYRTNSLLLDKYGDVFEELGNKDLLEYDKKEDKLISGTGKIKEDPIEIVEIMNRETDFQEGLIKSLVKAYDKLANSIEADKNKVDKKKTIGILVRTNEQLREIIDIGNREYKKKLSFHIRNSSIGNLYSLDSTIDLYKLVMALLYNKNPKYLINLYSTSYINTDLNLWEVYKSAEEADRDSFMIYEKIMEKWPLDNWDNYIDDLRQETTLMVLREIIYELKPWNNYAREVGGSIDGYQAKLYKGNLDLLFEKMSSSSDIDYLTLSKMEEFLNIMITTGVEEESRIGVEDESNINVICTTIHKAKGLEYDVVIMPYTDWKIGTKDLFSDIIIKDSDEGYKVGYRMSNRIKNSHYNSLYKSENEDQQKEEIRILYVALTRAKEKIILFQYKDKDDHLLQNEIGGLYI